MHSSSVYGTLRVDDRRKVYRHPAVLIAEVIVAQQYGQRSAVCLIGVVQRVIRVLNFIHSLVDFLVEMVVMFQGVNLKDLPNVIRHKRAAQRGFLRGDIRSKDNGSWKKR